MVTRAGAASLAMGLAGSLAVGACLVTVDESRVRERRDGGPALTDGAAVDARTADSAAADAAPTTVDAGLRHCAEVDAAFCDDFDVGPLGTGWRDVSTVQAMAGLSSESARSLPRSFLVDFDDDGGVRVSKGVVSRDLSRPPGAAITVSADLRVVRFPPTAALVQMLSVVFVDFAGIVIGVQGDRGSLVVHGATDLVYDFAIPADRWFHVECRNDLQAGTVTLSIDGARLVDTKPGLVRNDLGYVLAAGAAEREGQGGTRVFLDNVIVR